MRRISLALLVCLIVTPSLYAREKAQGWCQDGNYTVTISGTGGTSTNKFQRSFPSCTVTVYTAGTLTLASIYSDNAGTAKANPFTAAGTGRWFFYANNGRYDVKFSGGGIPTPFTIGDQLLNDPNTLTSCSDFAGNAAQQLQAAWMALPVTGGVIDCRKLSGAQILPFDPFVLMTSPTTVLFGSVTLTASVSLVIPLNITVDFAQGGILSMNMGTTTNVFGEITGTISQHFTTGAGTILFVSNRVRQVYPQWWGAVANGINPPTVSTTDNWPAIQAATDSIIAGQSLGFPTGTLNAIQGATAGIVYFTPGTYYIKQTIDLCHFNGCAIGVGNPVAGLVNSCITFRGFSRPQVTLITDQSIDMFHMYSFACPSSIESMTIDGSGNTTGVRIRGNQTTIRDVWTLLSHAFIVQNDSTAQTADTVFEDIFCDATGSGGPGNCITETDLSGGMLQGPLGQHIVNVGCHGGNICILSDSLYDSFIDGIHSDTVGSAVISLAGAHNVAISNIEGTGAHSPGLISANETCITVAGSNGVTMNNINCRLFEGPALIVSALSTGISLSAFTFLDDVANSMTTAPYEIQTDSSELTVKGGSITNNNGFPINAFQLQSGALRVASTDIDGVTIKGSKFNSTVIEAQAGGGGMQRLDIENNDIRTSWVIGAMIHIAADVTHAYVHHNSISAGGLVTWLQSTNDATAICIDDNLVGSGNVLIGSGATNIGSFPTGCFAAGSLAFVGIYAGSEVIGPGGAFILGTTTFAALGLQPNNTMWVCTDCKGKADGAAWGDVASGSGTGSLVMKETGIWRVK